jgi:enterochelin esterase-like enzyme
MRRLEALTKSPDHADALDAFWNNLVQEKHIPLVGGTHVAFLYRGKAHTVAWHGDFDGWETTDTPESLGERLGCSNIWRRIHNFPADARLDYKIVLNGSKHILDPANPHQQISGFGVNSELRMPKWVYPEETLRKHGVAHGTLSETKFLTSKSLAYMVGYQVYTPAEYHHTSPYMESLYVTDGHEYADDARGSLIIILDNLIAEKKIRPLITVFVDPREPAKLANNRRQSEYKNNDKFIRFVTSELVPVIDGHYRTIREAAARAVLGTSSGGFISAYFGVRASKTFGQVAIQSPAFWQKPDMVSLYKASPKLPLKIFLSSGKLYDGNPAARRFKAVLEAKGYPFHYIESNEGHSWGNWRAKLAEMLVFFFGKHR